MIRQTVHTFVVIAVIVIVCRSLLVLGWLSPLVVEGSSMAPTLHGAHVLATCPDCTAKTRIGSDQLPRTDNFACANCLSDNMQLMDAVPQPADQIVVDRRFGWLFEPKRWDIVVARRPDDADRLCVKRVLGLPGETVQFVDGDLYADGSLVRKTWRQQKRLRVLVHAESAGRQRWRAVQGACEFDGVAWHVAARDGESATLRYRHPDGRPITDDFAENHRVRRRLNLASDLMLTTNVRLDPDAVCRFVITRRGESISVLFHSMAGALAIGDESPPVAAFDDVNAAYYLPSESSIGVALSCFDRQIMVVVDGEVRAVQPLPSPKLDPDGEQQVQLHVDHGQATFSNLCLWRDVYYENRPTDPRPTNSVGWSLGHDEWFLVGDNQAVSHDSRSWTPRAGVPERLIVGRLVGKPR